MSSNSNPNLVDMNSSQTFSGDKIFNGNLKAEGLRLALLTKKESYAIGLSDHTILCDASTTRTFTITLPSALVVGAGKLYRIKKNRC